MFMTKMEEWIAYIARVGQSRSSGIDDQECNMRRRDFMAGLLLLASIEAHAAAQELKRTLKLSAAENPGYVFAQSKKILEAAYLQLNIVIDITTLPAIRSLREANDGTFDGELVRISTIERDNPNLIRVPTPIGTYKISPVVLNAPSQDLSSFAALRESGLRIGTLMGMRAVVDQLEGFQLETPKSQGALFKMLADDRVDVVLLPTGYLAAAMTSLPLTLREALQSAVELSPVQVSPVYHYLHKKNSALVASVDRELQKLTRNGTIKRLWAQPD